MNRSSSNKIKISTSIKKDVVISSYDSIDNPFYSGGGAIAVHAVARRLTKKFRVTILTASFKGSKNNITDGVKYQYISWPFFGPQVGQIVFQVLLPFFALSKKYDCWIESFTPPFSTSFLQLYTKKPVIGLVHMLSGEDMNRKYNLPFQAVESIGLKTYKYFIVLSENIKNKIAKVNNFAKFLVTKNGIDIPKRLPDYSNKVDEYILFIGRIEVNQKGLDLLIAAYKKVFEQHRLVLKIAGSGSQAEIEKLKALIVKNNLQDKVQLLGRVNGPEKIKTITKASLIVISSRFETFSITALEAITYGIPLICFDIQGMSWIPKHLSLRAKSFSTNSLASRINTLLSSKTKRSNMSQLQIKESKKYSWDKVAMEYENFLTEII